MDAVEIDPSPRPAWYQVWWHVWSHPGPQSFRKILGDPGASPSRGFLWVGLTSLITTLISFTAMYSWLNQFESNGGFPNWFLFMLCFVLLSPLFGIIGLAISAGIYHGIARLFGGTGIFGDMLYALAAIYAPSALLALPGVLFTFIYLTFNPYSQGYAWIPSICTGVWGLIVGIYTLVLYVSAIEAVENIGIGMAVLTYFLPGIVMFILSVCLTLVSFLATGSLLLQNSNWLPTP